MKKIPSSSTSTTRRGCLPCNDPERPDWAFFRSVFANADGSIDRRVGRRLAVPSDPKKARARLRKLLILAHAIRPYRLIRLAYFGEGRQSDMMRALASAIRGDLFNLETSRVGADAIEAFGGSRQFTDPGMRSAVNYVIRALWAIDASGRKIVARKAVYRELGTNTNEPTRCWLPEACGVVSYLRARLSHIVLAYHDEHMQRDAERHVAYDDVEAEVSRTLYAEDDHVEFDELVAA